VEEGGVDAPSERQYAHIVTHGGSAAAAPGVQPDGVCALRSAVLIPPLLVRRRPGGLGCVLPEQEHEHDATTEGELVRQPPERGGVLHDIGVGVRARRLFCAMYGTPPDHLIIKGSEIRSIIYRSPIDHLLITAWSLTDHLSIPT
jgi:hypothetical protein